jgi:hypothetical protein
MFCYDVKIFALADTERFIEPALNEKVKFAYSKNNSES